MQKTPTGDPGFQDEDFGEVRQDLEGEKRGTREVRGQAAKDDSLCTF